MTMDYAGTPRCGGMPPRAYLGKCGSSVVQRRVVRRGFRDDVRKSSENVRHRLRSFLCLEIPRSICRRRHRQFRKKPDLGHEEGEGIRDIGTDEMVRQGEWGATL